MKELTNEVLEFLKERRWDNLRPSDLAKSISIEAAELLELFQWSNLTIDETKSDPELMTKLRGELADVIIYCLQMSALLDIDATQAVEDKLDKVRAKYPAELMRDRSGNEHGGGNAYQEIKKKYREG